MEHPVPRSFVYCGPLMPRGEPKNVHSESNNSAFITGILSFISSSGGSLKSEQKILKIQEYNKCIVNGFTDEFCKEKYLK
jgi:hypothetical protein